MREVQITIPLYEKGDRVLTGNGAGTVLEDEEIPRLPDGRIDRLSFSFNEVKVKLDESCSEWSGRYGAVETATMSLLRQE